ncbi:MAG: ribonuclease HI family protein, partial [Patescibacteria group bacterium]
MEKIIIYTDGGSRGNPGEAAIGIVIKNESGDTIKTYGEVLGIATNNIAEYTAIVVALQKVKQLLGKERTKKTEIEFRMDSELAMKQLNGEYKIENEDLQPLFLKIWNLKFDFGKMSFKHIPREKNKEADKLVNEALNRKKETLF